MHVKGFRRKPLETLFPQVDSDLDSHHFLDFFVHDAVNGDDVLIGQGLDVFTGLLFLVLAHFLVL